MDRFSYDVREESSPAAAVQAKTKLSWADNHHHHHERQLILANSQTGFSFCQS